MKSLNHPKTASLGKVYFKIVFKTLKALVKNVVFWFFLFVAVVIIYHYAIITLRRVETVGRRHVSLTRHFVLRNKNKVSDFVTSFTKLVYDAA